MRDLRYGLFALALLMLSIPAFAQSGGGSSYPSTITIRPPWSDTFKSAQESVGTAVGPVLVLFVTNARETGWIQVQVSQRDSDRPEVATIQNMGYARLVISRAQFKDAQKRKGAATGAAALALKYGVKSLPAGVVTDNFGNLLFPVSPARLSSRGMLSMARGASSALKKLVQEIKEGYRAGETALKGNNKAVALAAFEKIAVFQGHALALKARAQIKKLKASQ